MQKAISGDVSPKRQAATRAGSGKTPKARYVRRLGAVLLVLGVLGFLFASVGLSGANKAQDIKAPAGVTIVLSADDPQVKARQQAAEMVLFGSLVGGGLGLVMLALSLVSRK